MAHPVQTRSIDVRDAALDASWDESVDRLPGATFFHTRAWAAVLNSAYGFRPHHLALRDAGTTVAALPLCEIRSWITGRRGIGLPYTDRCEPLASDPATANRLFQAACELGRERGWRRIEVRGTVPDPRAIAAVQYYEHRVLLTPDPESVLAQAESAVRRAIRKAERSGVEVRFDDSWDALAIFRRLLEATRRRHGAPPQPERFFRALHEHVLGAGRGVIALAEHRDTAVAGALFLRHGDTALFKFGASDDEARPLRPNHLVLGRAIERFCGEGCMELNLGRTSLDNEGLRRFKRSWGAQEEVIGYRCFDLERNQFIATPDRADGWQSTLVRRLPSSAWRLIANTAYRHFA